MPLATVLPYAARTFLLPCGKRLANNLTLDNYTIELSALDGYKLPYMLNSTKRHIFMGTAGLLYTASAALGIGYASEAVQDERAWLATTAQTEPNTTHSLIDWGTDYANSISRPETYNTPGHRRNSVAFLLGTCALLASGTACRKKANHIRNYGY